MAVHVGVRGPGHLSRVGGVIYSPEAQAAFAAMSTQPSDLLKALYDNCIRSLITAGIWTKLDALYLLNVETAQAARVNIKAPGTFDLTATSSPTFTTKVGYAGDGAAAYLNTNLNATTAPSPNYTQDSASVFVWNLQQVGENKPQISQVSGSAATIVYARRTTDTCQEQINSAGAAVASSITDGRGFVHANRSAAAAEQLYKNGVSIATGVNVSAAVLNTTFSLLRGASLFSAASIAMGGVGSSLTAQNAADLYAALNAFKTGVDAL